MSGSKTPRKPTSGSASDPSAASLSRKRNNKQAGFRTPSPSTATVQATLASPNPVVNDEDLSNPEPSNSLACEFNRPDCEDSDSRTDIGPSHPNLANEDVEMTAADSPDNSSVGEAKTPRSAKRSPRSVFDSLRRGSGASGGPAADSDSESKESLRALASRLLRRAVFLVRGALRLAGPSWQPQPQSEPGDEHMVPTLIDSFGPKPDSPLGDQCHRVSEANQIAPNETIAVSDWHASVTPPAATPAPPVGGFKASAVPDSLLSSKLMNTGSDIDARCDPNGDGTNKNPTPTSSDGDPTDRCQSVPAQLDVTTFVARRGP